MKDAMIEINGRRDRGKKKMKKARVRSFRKKIKSDTEFIPQYNRYSGYR